jgi:hypothetical protein
VKAAPWPPHRPGFSCPSLGRWKWQAPGQAAPGPLATGKARPLAGTRIEAPGLSGRALRAPGLADRHGENEAWVKGVGPRRP